jgi:glycosyltransferase involved in cell wall biosynthesis
MALSRVDLVLAISQAVAKVNGRALGINPERIHILHHGVNLERFHPDNKVKTRRSARLQFGLNEKDRVILVPTTFRREKNLFTTIDVVARLRERYPDLQLLLTGNFSFDANAKSTRKEMERKMDQLGLRGRVHLTGYVERMEDAYATADLVCVPTEYEAFGLPAVEAMGSGLPVIGSNQGAFPEIVEDGVSGLCIDTQDVGAWCQAIESLFDNPERATTMGQAGRVRAEAEFSGVDHWIRLFDLYEEGRGRPLHHRKVG